MEVIQERGRLSLREAREAVPKCQQPRGATCGAEGPEVAEMAKQCWPRAGKRSTHGGAEGEGGETPTPHRHQPHHSTHQRMHHHTSSRQPLACWACSRRDSREQPALGTSRFRHPPPHHELVRGEDCAHQARWDVHVWNEKGAQVYTNASPQYGTVDAEQNVSGECCMFTTARRTQRD